MEADELRAKSIDELLDLYDELRENEFCNWRDKKESDEEAFDEEAFGEEDYFERLSGS